jgi:hypothetical protein
VLVNRRRVIGRRQQFVAGGVVAGVCRCVVCLSGDSGITRSVRVQHIGFYHDDMQALSHLML